MKLIKKKLNKKVISLYGLIFAFLAIISLGFAWFTGSIDKNGITIQTGEIIADCNYYYFNDADNTLYLRSKDSTDLTTVAAIAMTDKTDNAYFIIEREKDSIDIDYSISLTLENGETTTASIETAINKEITYVGGYWFKIQKITDAVNSTSLVETVAMKNTSNEEITPSDSEKKLFSYISKTTSSVISTNNTGTEYPFTNLTGNNITGTLQGDNYQDYYVMTFGFKSEIKQYVNNELKIRAKVNTAQVGGLTKESQQASTGITHINSLQEFLTCLKSYKPGETIIIEKSFTYNGDLVFTTPVNLKVVNSTLRVDGNLIFSFDYDEEYYIDTATKGQIITRKVGAYGSNIEIDTPNSQVTFYGKGSISGTGDIYSQGSIIINASYTDGAIFSGVNFYATDTDGNASTNPIPVYFEDDTCITVSENTYIYSIEPLTKVETGYTNPEIVKIVNYGTIDKLTFSSMNNNSKITAKPQIFLDNYGTYDLDQDYKIILPSWSSKYVFTTDDNGVQHWTSGNTRIKQREDSNNLYISESVSSSFKDSDIERDFVDQFLIVNATSGGVDYDVTINYAEDFNSTTQQTVTNDLYRIIYLHYNPTETYSGTTAQKNEAQEYLSNYTKIEIICYQGKVLTDSEIGIIRTNCGSTLESLDLENAILNNNKVSNTLFQNFTSLTELILPNTITYIGDAIIRNCTSLHEISIPASVASTHDTAFRLTYNSDTSRQYVIVHALSTNYVYTNLASGFASGKSTNGKNTYGLDHYLLVNENLLSSYSSWPSSVCPESKVTDDFEYLYRQTEDGNYQIVRYLGGKNHYTFKQLADKDGTIKLGEIHIKDNETVYASSIYDRAYQYAISSDYVSGVPYNYIKVTFLDSVEAIYNYSFYNLQTSELDLNKVETLGDYTFSTTKASTNNTINKVIATSLKTTGQYTFAYLTLPSVNIKNIETIGDYSFYQTTLYSDNTTFDMKNVITIGNSAFEASNIKSQELKSLKYAYSKSFFNCDSLVCFKAINLEITGDNAFNSCDNLELLYVPSCTTYGANFFNVCPKLKEVYIGAYKAMYGSTRELQASSGSVVAYYICGTSPNKLEFASTETFASKFFGGASNYRIFINSDLYYYYDDNLLTSVLGKVITCNMDAKDLVKGGSYTPTGNTLDIGEIVCDVYDKTDVSESYAKTLYFFPSTLNDTTTSLINVASNTYYTEDSVTYNDTTYNITEIGDNAYVGCTYSNIKLKISDNTTKLGDNNFKTAGFIEINTGGITEIGDYAFANSTCKAFKLPNITSIGDHCFSESSISSLESATNLVNVGDYAFYKCTGLTDISLLAAKTIGNYAFSGCSNLKTVTFDKLKSIGNSVFTSLYNLTTVTINDCESIGNYAFNDCQFLTSSYNLASLTSIGVYAFNKTLITSFEAPQLTIISNYAFANTSALAKCNFPSTIEIGEYAFYICNSSDYEFGENVTTIKKYAFYNSNIVHAIFPNVTCLEAGVFYYCYNLTLLQFDVLDTLYAITCWYCNKIAKAYFPNLHYIYGGANATIFGCCTIGELYIGQLYGGSEYTNFYRLNCWSTCYNVYICGATANRDYDAAALGNHTIYDYFWNDPLFVFISDDMLSYITSACVPCKRKLINTGTTNPLYLIKYGDWYYNGVNLYDGIFTIDKDNKTATLIKSVPWSITPDMIGSDTYTTPGLIKVGNIEYKVTKYLDTAYRYTYMYNINLIIHDNVEEIASRTFQSGYEISQTSRYLLSLNTGNLTSIPYRAFYCWVSGSISCKIDSIIMPKVTTVGEGAFYSINGSTVSAPFLKTIGGYGFYNCGFVSYDFPLLESIGQASFYNNYNLINVNFPNLVTIDSYDNFARSSKIETVYIPKCTSSLWRTFTGCNKIQKIYTGINSSYSNEMFYSSAGGGANGVRYLYLCGTSSTFSSIKMGANPNQHVSIFVNENLYTRVKNGSSKYSNIQVINIGSGDAKDLIGVGEITLEGYTNKFPEYEYYLDSNGNAVMAACFVESFTGDTFTTPKTVDLTIDGNTVTKKVVGIADYAYYYSDIEATTLVIEDNIKWIGGNIFGPSKKFTNVNVDVETIKANAFNGISTITSITIGDSCTSIEANAFNGITNAIMTIENGSSMIPNTQVFGSDATNQINVLAFVYDAYLTSAPWANIPSNKIICVSPSYTDSNNIKYYYEITNESNKTISIHHIIGDATIDALNGIITIPNTINGYTVTGLTSRSMQGLTGLTDLILPSNLSKFDFSYVHELSTLKSYSIDSNNEYYYTSNGVLYNKDQTIIISYPKGKQDEEFSLLNTLSYIPSYTFAYNTYLKKITFNASALIDAYAFASCTGLTSVIINGTGVSTIEANAFGSCTNITSIVINGSCEFGSYAFDNCTGLLSITITNDGTFKSYAFNDCSSLATININGKAVVYSYAFDGCVLSNVTIGGKSSINSYAFANANINSDGVINLKLTNTSEVTDFKGYYFFDNVFKYNIYVPSTLLDSYKSSILFDQETILHIEAIAS